MNNFILIFIGGGLGSVTRYGLGAYIAKQVNSIFPWGTLTINIAASFILGLLAGFIFQRSGNYETQRLLIGIGFCGGFSTFSTFSLELFEMIRNGNAMMAILYIVASVFATLIAFWAAHLLLRVA